MEFRSSRAHNSVRNHTLTRNLDNTPEELKNAYNQRGVIKNPSPQKNVSTSIGHLSMGEERFSPQKMSKFRESQQKWLQSRKMLTNKEIIHLKYDNSVTRSYEEDKDFIKNRIIEREQAKKETPWKTIADDIKNRKKLKTLNGESKKKLASNKIKFKYSSLRDVVAEEKKEPPKAKFKWKMIWLDTETKEPQQDFSIPVEEDNFDQIQDEDTVQDYDFMSRNKWLQQKYDENFHSHIISTNTVSLVAESKDMKEVDRMELVPDEVYISSDEDSL